MTTTNPTIESVCITGLHDQLNYQVNLKPQLNILFGKNGCGKTTFLHIIANLLELDFKRFSHIRFKSINIKLSNEDKIDIEKSNSEYIVNVFLNGNKIEFDNNGDLTSESENLLRNRLGQRATYLPAFRSTLERTRSAVPENVELLQQTPRNDEKNTIREKELEIINETEFFEGFFPTTRDLNRNRSEAESVSEKTILCRRWFGNFVPLIRYPSITDVEESLTESYRSALEKIHSYESRSFETFFAKAFRVVTGLSKVKVDESSEQLLRAIYAILNSKSVSNTSQIWSGSHQFLHRTIAELNAKDNTNKNLESAIPPLLFLYKETLRERLEIYTSYLQEFEAFENSANRFLDGKKLNIRKRRSDRRTSVTVYIETDSAQILNLSTLSSGERQILTMLYSASRSRFREGPLLVDEPEISLHIDWQRIILEELKNLSAPRQIITCTHSPEVGADHLIEIQKIASL